MLSPAEIAKRWGVNIKTVYSAIQSGQLPALRLARKRFLIPAHVVISVEEKGCVAPMGANHGGTTR